MPELSKEEAGTEVLMGVRPAAAELLIWGKRDGVYEGGALRCCHNHELLLLPLVAVAPEKKKNPVLFK